MAFEKVKAYFGDAIKSWTDSWSDTFRVPRSPVAAQTAITTNLAKFLVDLSNFESMEVNSLYSQLYMYEPVVGGVTDRMSTMMRQAYQGVYLKEEEDSDDDDSDESLDAIMLKVAKQQEEAIGAQNMMETLGESMVTYGNVYLHMMENNGMFTYEMFPPEYVSMVKTELDVNVVRVYPILTNPGFFCLNERNTFQFQRRVIPYGDIIHIKYKDTPLIMRDRLGRMTYGVYSISPLTRVIIPVWWKRQIQIIDILWRARNVPREHHQVSAGVYSLNQFDGRDWSEKRAKATTAAQSFMQTYRDSMAQQPPDAGLVTLDTVKVTTVGGNAAYMHTNELFQQIEDQIWTALNIPPSMINGKGTSSYASELVISNYVSGKVIQLAEKVKPAILNLIRKRCLAINPLFPVDKLDIKLELSMASSEMEAMRQCVLMRAAGVYTEDEIRARGGEQPLTEKQRKYVVTPQGSAAQANESAPITQSSVVQNNAGDKKNGEQPETPTSQMQHSRDPAENTIRDDTSGR